MKVLMKWLATTLLLISADNVLAEGEWQFRIEVGGPRIECNTGYAGSTADALGCSGIAPAARTMGRNSELNADSRKTEVLELAQVKPDNTSFPTPPLAADQNQFWVMKNGDSLDYGQVVLSSVMDKPASGSQGETENTRPEALPSKVSLASYPNPDSAPAWAP